MPKQETTVAAASSPPSLSSVKSGEDGTSVTRQVQLVFVFGLANGINTSIYSYIHT